MQDLDSPKATIRHRRAVPIVLLAALLAAGALAACGGSKNKTAAVPAAATQSADGFGGPGGGPGGFGERGLFNDPKVKQCLDAAGIVLPTPTFTGTRPSFSPGERPSFSPGARPSFTRSPGAGGFGGRFGGQNSVEFQKIQQALQACGITLPTRGARPDAAPSSTSTA